MSRLKTESKTIDNSEKKSINPDHEEITRNRSSSGGFVRLHSDRSKSRTLPTPCHRQLPILSRTHLFVLSTRQLLPRLCTIRLGAVLPHQLCQPIPSPDILSSHLQLSSELLLRTSQLRLQPFLHPTRFLNHLRFRRTFLPLIQRDYWKLSA